MNEASIAQDFVTAANTIMGFAVLQNIALTYSLVKREVRLRIDSKWKWIHISGGVAWNCIYVVAIWWCSMSALEIMRPIDSVLLRSATILAYGKCATVILFVLVPAWFFAIYDLTMFWSDDNDQEIDTPLATQQVNPADRLGDG